MSGPVLLLLLLGGVALAADLHRFKRLTTFGKAPEKSNSHQIGKGKDCKSDADCVVTHSACVLDKDNKKRCICEDGVYPVSGVCERIRAVQLHKPCQSSNECIEGAECKINTNTTNPAYTKTKVCLCTEDTIEEDGECNGCIRLETSGWMILLLGLSSIAAINR